MKDKMTPRQKQLIDTMNDYCNEQFIYNENTTKKEASEFIDKYIEEFKLSCMDNFQLNYIGE